MNAQVQYAVKRQKIEGEGYGGTYTKCTLVRVTTMGGVSSEEVPVADFNSYKESQLFEAWAQEANRLMTAVGNAR